MAALRGFGSSGRGQWPRSRGLRGSEGVSGRAPGVEGVGEVSGRSPGRRGVGGQRPRSGGRGAGTCAPAPPSPPPRLRLQELELYFTEPQQLLDLFTELEEQNLSLIQNTQEMEEALEDLSNSLRSTQVRM